MTLPRRIVPGTTWFVTRRTTRRHHLLRPDADGTIQSLYWYVTAVLAAEMGIELHATQVLSTHMHEVLTDTRGCLPEFLQQRNRILANAVKVHRNWPEEVFSRKPTSCVALYGVQAVLREIGYTIANCVEAGLVERPEDWPGVKVLENDIGERVVRVRRPNIYFDSNNKRWPPYVELCITMPPALRTEDLRAPKLALRAAIVTAVGLARESAQAAGRQAGSVAALMRAPFTRRARSFEEFGTRNPSFAAGGVKDETRRALAEKREFCAAYRTAFACFVAGARDIVFPRGTWRWARELALKVVNRVQEVNVGRILLTVDKSLHSFD